jgi:hypothetical protein
MRSPAFHSHRVMAWQHDGVTWGRGRGENTKQEQRKKREHDAHLHMVPTDASLVRRCFLRPSGTSKDREKSQGDLCGEGGYVRSLLWETWLWGNRMRIFALQTSTTALPSSNRPSFRPALEPYHQTEPAERARKMALHAAQVHVQLTSSRIHPPGSSRALDLRNRSRA